MRRLSPPAFRVRVPARGGSGSGLSSGQRAPDDTAGHGRFPGPVEVTWQRSRTRTLQDRRVEACRHRFNASASNGISRVAAARRYPFSSRAAPARRRAFQRRHVLRFTRLANTRSRTIVQSATSGCRRSSRKSPAASEPSCSHTHTAAYQATSGQRWRSATTRLPPSRLPFKEWPLTDSIKTTDNGTSSCSTRRVSEAGAALGG